MEQGIAEIPSALDKVFAVVTGGGYDDEAFAKMKDATIGCKEIPWLRPDKTKPGPQGLPTEYAKAVAQRTKDTLNSIDRSKSGVFLY